MTCQHCVMSVTEEIGGIDGVSEVHVELATGAVTVLAERAIGRERSAWRPGSRVRPRRLTRAPYARAMPTTATRPGGGALACVHDDAGRATRRPAPATARHSARTRRARHRTRSWSATAISLLPRRARAGPTRHHGADRPLRHGPGLPAATAGAAHRAAAPHRRGAWRLAWRTCRRLGDRTARPRGRHPDRARVVSPDEPTASAAFAARLRSIAQPGR